MLCSGTRRQGGGSRWSRDREREEQLKSRRNRERARLCRHRNRKARRAFMKFYQKSPSFTLHKRKTQENTIPYGLRGQAGNKGAEVLMCIFYFCLYQKMLHFVVRSVGYTQSNHKQTFCLWWDQFPIILWLSDLSAPPLAGEYIGFICRFLLLAFLCL